jgi:hypothetical protein
MRIYAVKVADYQAYYEWSIRLLQGRGKKRCDKRQ